MAPTAGMGDRGLVVVLHHREPEGADVAFHGPLPVGKSVVPADVAVACVLWWSRHDAVRLTVDVTSSWGV